MSRSDASLTELTATLERSFRTTHGLLEELVAGLRDRRSAWVSARPDTIAPSDDLEGLAKRLAAEDEARRVLVEELARSLPGHPGVAATATRVNVTRIVAALPAAIGARLRQVADAATKLACEVRTELALGRRLLEFSQRTHDGLVTELSAQPHSGAPRGYDRTATARPAAGPASATIIDGRM